MDRSFRQKVNTRDQWAKQILGHSIQKQHNTQRCMGHSSGQIYDGTQNESQQSKNTEIISNIFSNHSGMKLEISKGKPAKFIKRWKQNNTTKQ